MTRQALALVLLTELGSVASVGRVMDATPEAVQALLEGRHVARRRGDSTGTRWRWSKRPDACWKGHAFDEPNTITRRNGSRACRECHRERVRAFEPKRAPRSRRSA